MFVSMTYTAHDEMAGCMIHVYLYPWHIQDGMTWQVVYFVIVASMKYIVWDEVERYMLHVYWYP